MERSVEIQLLQVRLNSFYLYKQHEGVLIYFCTLSRVQFAFPIFLVCVSEFAKEARGGSSGQPSSGKHILVGLADRTFPVYTLAPT